MNTEEKIEKFLSVPAYAVVGASDNKMKYGYRCYKSYLQHGRKVYPVNPICEKIEGNVVYKNLASLPEKVESISIITPPRVTEKIVDDAIANGVSNIWMQPGAESMAAVEKAEAAGLNVIYGVPCLMVVLGYHGL